MTSKREKSTNKRMRKIALIICEGETEENYINLLKKWYKSPIKIVSHISGAKITQKLLDNYKKNLQISPHDKVDLFLMYDMDVPAVNEKLEKYDAEKLLSNPCFEIWLLLHVKFPKTNLTSKNVLKELVESDTVWQSYKKPGFTEPQKNFLMVHLNDAITKAKKLEDFKNPSSTIYKLIDFLREDSLYL